MPVSLPLGSLYYFSRLTTNSVVKLDHCTPSQEVPDLMDAACSLEFKQNLLPERYPELDELSLHMPTVSRRTILYYPPTQVSVSRFVYAFKVFLLKIYKCLMFLRYAPHGPPIIFFFI
jgi:hypothetical protein